MELVHVITACHALDLHETNIEFIAQVQRSKRNFRDAYVDYAPICAVKNVDDFY